MESRWYLSPGQTLQNTKIIDREHALHLTQEKWNEILKNNDRKKLKQEALDREEARKKEMKEKSAAMTKDWENSTENLRAKKEEMRRAKFDKKTIGKDEMYFKMRKEQEKERQKYVEDMKQKTFLAKGQPRSITMALLHSDVLAEREMQVSLKKILKADRDELEAAYAEKVKREAEQEAQEKIEKERNKIIKERQHYEELKKIIEERKRISEEEERKQLEEDAKDNTAAAKEFEWIQQKEKEMTRKAKKDLHHERTQFIKDQKELEKLSKQKDDEYTEVAAIYNEAKHEINCIRKYKEEEFRNRMTAKRELARKVIESCEDKKAKDIEKYEHLEDGEVVGVNLIGYEVKEDNRAKIRNDFMEQFEMEEKKKQKENEIKKWEQLSRLKVEENNRKYELKKKQEEFEKKIVRRGEIQESLEHFERNKLVEKEKECVPENLYIDFDKRFFNYAEDILKIAEENGRNTRPIEKVIRDYIKENEMENSEYAKILIDRKKEMQK